MLLCSVVVAGKYPNHLIFSTKNREPTACRQGSLALLVGNGAMEPFRSAKSNVAAVVSDIEKQEEHHRTVTFEEEFRLFLKRYRVAFDERYV